MGAPSAALPKPLEDGAVNERDPGIGTRALGYAPFATVTLNRL
jgi:hypothetical protein